MSKNLLFKGYNYTSFIYNTSYGPGYKEGHGLCYDPSNFNNISYYAELQPDTTYTIKAHDLSTCFRIGISDRNLINFDADCFEQGLGQVYEYNMFTQSEVLDGTTDPFTFTTSNIPQYLICHVSNTAQKDIRVMLNIGRSFHTYEEPVDILPSMWMRNVNSIGGYFSAALPRLQLQGCAAQAKNLTSVIFPESCKSLGRYSFRNTQVYHAVLAEDCTYYRTTFPDHCTVTGGVLLEVYPRDRIISTENDYLISTESDYLVSEGGDY